MEKQVSITHFLKHAIILFPGRDGQPGRPADGDSRMICIRECPAGRPGREGGDGPKGQKGQRGRTGQQGDSAPPSIRGEPGERGEKG